jgi:hypothetical protein
MALLTPTERVTLELIRATGTALPGHVPWALEKGYAKTAGNGRHRLTEAGIVALAGDAEQRMANRSANAPRRQ